MFSEYSMYDPADCNQTYHFCRTILNDTTSCCGANFQYYEIYSTSSNAIEMWFAYYDPHGNIAYKIDTTDYDPTQEWCGSKRCDNWYPSSWQQQYAGETHDSQDAVPGSVGFHTSFTSMAFAPKPWDGVGTPSFQDIGNLSDNAQFDRAFCSFRANITGQNTGYSSFDMWDQSC